MSSDPSMPRDFGWRYLLWLCYTNKLSILFFLQSVALELTVDPDVPKPWVHHMLAIYNMIGIILAQISRAQGKIPPPTKETKP